MNWLGPRSLFRGLQVALALWMVMAAGLLATTRYTVPQDLLWIEGVYTLLAALLIGAIVGGVPRRIFLKDSE